MTKGLIVAKQRAQTWNTMSEEEFDDEQFDEEEQTSADESVPEKPLSKELAGECLSLLCKTGNGLAHAYVRIELKDKKLTDISILNCFVHLRYVDVSGNALTDISCLNALPHLLSIKADRNKLSSINIQELQYLQIASFANNSLSSTQGLAHPMLENLNLSSNKIADLAGLTDKNLPSLRILDLHGNQLQSCAGIKLPSLQCLYLASNKLSRVDGLEGLKQMTTLHLRDNQISTLDGFAPSMEALQYLNIRGNAVEEISELKKLKCLSYLRALVLAECPVCEIEEYRVEVCILLRQLERLDKDEFTEEERADAEEVSQQRNEEQDNIDEN